MQDVIGACPHLRERLRAVAGELGSGDELARRAGIPRRTLANYLSGRSEPKVSAVAAVAKAAGVSLHWLATGEGSMRPDGAESTPAPAPAQAVDAALLARLLEGVSNVYREIGGRVVARDQARIAGDLYAEVVAVVPEADDALRAGAAAMALNRLRQELRAAAEAPAESKRPA